MPTWNEKSTRIVTVRFFDETGQAVTPSAGTYRIDSSKGVSIKESGDLPGPLASAIAIIISSLENAMVNSRLTTEEHKLTVEFDYGLNPVKHGTAEFVFNIKNLQGVV